MSNPARSIEIERIHLNSSALLGRIGGRQWRLVSRERVLWLVVQNQVLELFSDAIVYVLAVAVASVTIALCDLISF